MIQPNYAELLTILREAPNSGITTAEIFKMASENIESQIPDPEQLSKMIYANRVKGFLTTSEAKGKKVHQITPEGITALAEFNGLETEKPSKPEMSETKEPLTMTEDNLLEEKISPEELFYLDPSNEFENAMIIIASSLREIRSQPIPVKIEHKSKKIDTLTRLGALMSDDIKLIFDEIINDLEQLKAT